MSTIHKHILWILLIFSSFPAFSSEVWYEVSRSANGHVTWRSSITGNFHHTFESTGEVFKGTSSNTGVVKGTSGAVSVGSVSGTISHEVSKQTVLNKVWQNGKAAAAFGGRLLNPLAKAYVAYEILNGIAMAKDYFWDEDKKNWYRAQVQPTTMLVKTNHYISLTSNPKTADEIEAWCAEKSDRTCAIRILEGATSQEISQAAIDFCGSFTKNGKTYVTDRRDAQSGCLSGINGIGIGVKSVPLKEAIPFTREDFMEVAQTAADAAVARYINAANLVDADWSAPEVYVIPGTVAQSAPYTDPQTGQAQQTRWDFGQDSAGKTTVRETILPRPDLTPKSPEAPAVDPQDQPKPGEDTKPDTGTGSGGSTPPNNPDLCALHPNILACQEMGKPEPGIFDEISIPHMTDETRYSPDDILPDNGVCPQPKTFMVYGKSIQISYDPLCRFMENIRGMVLIAFGLMTAFVIFGSLRRG